MMKAKAALRQILESRSRRFFVITLTLSVALVASLLAADEYIDKREYCARLSNLLTDVKRQSEQLDDLKARFDEQVAKLDVWQEKTINEDEIHDFRNKIVELIRNSGCQQRRLTLDQARFKDWSPGDHPLKTTKRSEDKIASYKLRSQRVSISASGTLNGIRELLAELHTEKILMHTEKISMKPVNASSKEIILDLEFILFDLQERQPKANSA